MNDLKKTPPVCKKDLKGKVFGDGKLLALDCPPQQNNNGQWEWLCQCQIHDVPPKYFRVSKLESGSIKSCGCRGGRRYYKDNDDLIGQEVGLIKVLSENRIHRDRPEFKVRCVVCGREKWLRAENIRKHVGISCHCAPALKHRTIGRYYVLKEERRNEKGFPEMLCEMKDSGDERWVLKEELLYTLAKELLTTTKTD